MHTISLNFLEKKHLASVSHILHSWIDEESGSSGTDICGCAIEGDGIPKPPSDSKIGYRRWNRRSQTGNPVTDLETYKRPEVIFCIYGVPLICSSTARSLLAVCCSIRLKL